jgi:Leucine-rich repeat (LRR) protein
MFKQLESLSKDTNSGGGADVEQQAVLLLLKDRKQLDKLAAVIESAKPGKDLNDALEKYQLALNKATKEYQEKMKLVDFKGEKIHRFEMEALERLVEDINQDYTQQREVNPEFEQKDLTLEDLGKQITVEDHEVKKINLGYLGLSKIPKSVNELINLQVLKLYSNEIQEIKGLDKLINLQELVLSGNKIPEIEGLDKLTNLQKLWLSRNKIQEIEGLDKLTNLQRLNLSNNKIKKIEGLDKLINLNTVYIRYHRNESDEFYNLPDSEMAKLRDKIRFPKLRNIY